MRSFTLTCLAGALVTALLTGCSASGDAEQQTLRVGFADSPSGFDPALTTTGASHQIIDLVYSGLTKLDADAVPQPDLATSWEISEDGTVYEFTLREGVTFHDGSEFDAGDVVHTFERLLDPETGYPFITQIEAVEDVTATSPTTVTFTLAEPFGPFLSSLAFPGTSIVPDSVGDEAGLTAEPIGTGPFTFETYRPNQELILQANTDYYVPDEPQLDTVHIQYIPNDTERATALLGGTLDFVTQINPRDYDRVTGTSGFTGSRIEGGQWHWIMINTELEPLGDPLVRKAISYAIDREALAETLFYGHAEPILGGPIPPWSWAYDDSTDQLPPGADVQKAKDLLREAGYPDGFELDATLGSAWPQLVAQGPLLQEMLAEVGITLNLSTMENPRFFEAVWAGGEYEISNMFWLSPLADPDDFMYQSYQCDSPMNPQNYCNEELDSILQSARYESDPDARRELYRQATEFVIDEMPLIPTVNAHILNAFTEDLQGWEPLRTGMFDSFARVSLSD